MLSPEQWQEVRRLHAGGMPIKQIARSKQIAPNTVRRVVRSPEPPRYQRPERASVAAPFEPLILRLLTNDPALAAPDIARRVKWPASASLLRSTVARLRKTLPPQRTAPRPQVQPVLSSGLALVDFRPGWAECGLWLPAQQFDVGHGQSSVCPVLLTVAGASGRLEARLLPSRAFRDVWIAHHRVLQEWDAVPHTLRWDTNRIQPLTTWFFGTEGWNLSWDTYLARAELSDVTVQTSLPTLALDAARRSLRAAFPPSPSEVSPQTFAADLKAWLDDTNATLPSTLMHWSAERSLMRQPAAAPELLGLRAQGRAVPDGDGYVAVAGSHYLVGPWGARRRLTVEVTDTEVVIRSSGYHAGGFHVVTYARSWARGVRLTHPQQHMVSESGTSRTVQGP
ncbi:helix-turn-helix domain-containing protein [Streptomyces sasae]|uniref:helix-turn-helix domain-containing protein n=1 Tax=Streptomyces sasae TaxID=1266772 RepID=UPI00292F3F8C|nr:helix-turn-helix domain-containing protein [Streptomyces sasae]